MSIKKKLVLSFGITLGAIFIINIFMYMSVHSLLSRVDEVYVSNVNLNELLEALNNVENSMKQYLDTKSSTALDSYYRADQDYSVKLEELNCKIVNQPRLIMEKNIYEQSKTYLNLAYETVQAKRGRNVGKYKSYFENTQTVYEDIQNCIFSLNNEQFKQNSKSYKSLVYYLSRLEYIGLMILVLLSMLDVILVIVMTRKMINPLVYLAKASNEIAQGNFNVTIPDNQQEDEVGSLTKAFQKMIVNIESYIRQIKESMERESKMKERELLMESKIKEAQLVSLQAQINPHFLFNTLNAGAQLAMMEGADKTTEFIENVAAFFRLNMKNMNQDATIGEEVQLVEYYIYILNVRFTGDIHYTNNIDEKLLDKKIPSMILQPIIENAIKYGIRNIEWEGYVSLSVYQKDEMIYLEIEDNGRGIEKDMIGQILEGKVQSNMTKDGNGIGLANVIERLRLFTGKEDVVDIVSEGENMGTTFRLKIPV